MSGTETKKKVPKKGGYENPALRALGIKRISIPSKKWMVFWTVLVGIGSTIAYDKYEQKQIRQKWMEKVKQFGEETYDINRIPRKLTIYIAPPPNDFLDESLKIFRKFIKPVLNSGSVEFQVFSENRQGDIRANVAQRIRDRRSKEVCKGNELKENVENVEKTSDDEDKTVSRSTLYKPADVLGLYKIFPKEIGVVSDDAKDDVSKSGGVICIGRGAFKEYISGLHEGLLGPLTKPEAVAAEEEKRAAEKADEPAIDEDNEEANLKPVPMKYISGKEYQDAPLAPELDMRVTVRDEKGVPEFFEQPVYVFPVPKVQGIMNTPRKIYNYLTKRYLADDFGNRASHIVRQETVPFEYKHTLMAAEEESDWPEKWIQKGLEKKSEWVQELDYDDRVISRLRVFDDKK